MTAAHDTGAGGRAFCAWRAGRRRAWLAIALVALAVPRLLWSWGAPAPLDPSPDALWPARSMLAVAAWPTGELPWDKYPEGFHLVAGVAEQLANRFWLTDAESAQVAADHAALIEHARARHDDPRHDPTVQLMNLASGHEAAHWKLVVAGRCATLLLLVVLLVAGAELAMAAAGPRFGWIGALAIALQPAIVHYGSTLNTDVPALAWSALGWALLVGGRVAPGSWRVVGAGAALGLAVATKDQYAAMVPGIAWFAWRRGAGRASGRAARFGLLALGGAFAYVLTSGVLNHASGRGLGSTWCDHVAHLFGAGSTPFREHDLSPRGLLGLLDDAGERLLTAAGVVGTAGIALLLLFVVLRRRWRALAWLLPGLTYLAGFLAPAGYVYPRFTLPFALCGALGLAWGIAHAQGARTRQRVVIGALALVFAGAEASQVGSARANDVRPAAVAELAARRGARVAATPAAAADDLVWIVSEPWLYGPFPPIAAPHRCATLVELAAAVKRGEPVARWLWFAAQRGSDVVGAPWIANIEKKLKMRAIATFEPQPDGRLAADPGGLLLAKVVLFERADG